MCPESDGAPESPAVDGDPLEQAALIMANARAFAQKTARGSRRSAWRILTPSVRDHRRDALDRSLEQNTRSKIYSLTTATVAAGGVNRDNVA
jgi:hypothetical protein